MMKKHIIGILLVVILSAVASVSAQSGITEYVVTAETANILVAPHIDSKIITTVNYGDIVEVFDEPALNGWYRIKLDDNFGYIQAKAIALADYTPLDTLQEWMGTGSSISEPFRMPAGRYFFHIGTSESDLFTVRLISVDGFCKDKIIFSYGVVSSDTPSRAYDVETTECEYVLEVEADSVWNISLEEVTPEYAAATSIFIEDGTAIEGTAQSVTDLTVLPQGFWVITLESEGDSIGLTSHVIDGDCPSIFKVELGEGPITYEVTYRTEEECVIAWGVDGGLVSDSTKWRAADWTISFEKIR